MGKKIVIIGAGMAGLSAGIHLGNNGYETTIVEAHSIAGGLVTAWKRGRYLFDGCVHWIPGCSEKSAFKPVNEEIFGPGLEYVRHETIMDIECLDSAGPGGDRFFHFYSDLDRLEAYMKEISPVDGKVIDEFTGLARMFERFRMPPSITPPELMTFSDRLGMVKFLPVVSGIKKIGRYSITGFANRFESPFLKEAFTRMSFGRDYPIVILILKAAFSHQGSSAYPAGGSRRLAALAEAKYLQTGGELRLGSRVKRILVEDGAARGVLLENGETLDADIVVSAADGRWTLFEALEGKYLTPDLEDLYGEKKLDVFESNLFVSLGLTRSFEGISPETTFFFDAPVSLCDGSSQAHLSAHIMNYDGSFAPEGCTVVNVMLSSWSHEYWTELRLRDREAYRRAKESVKDFVVDTLEAKLGGIREHVEEWDVATPATFIRYTGNWKGSIQGWMPDKNFLAAKPLRKTLPGLSNFYMAGQWTEPAGGITPCIKTGRDTAQIICAKDRKKFRTIPGNAPDPVPVAGENTGESTVRG